MGGYGYKSGAPYLNLSGLGGDYLVAHNLLRAHAKAYRLYEKKYKSLQKGKSLRDCIIEALEKLGPSHIG